LASLRSDVSNPSGSPTPTRSNRTLICRQREPAHLYWRDVLGRGREGHLSQHEFAVDSPLEGDGFEPSVPRQRSRNFLAFYVPAVIGQRPDSFGSREKTHIARIRAVSPSRWDREKPLPSIGESPTNRGAAGELTLSQGVCEPPGRRNWRNPFGEGMASDVQ